jgi:hypothetical protein
MGQLEHAAVGIPVPVLYVPLPQGEQTEVAVPPVPVLYVPAAQREQVETPAFEL